MYAPPSVTTLDWIIVGLTALMAVWGYAQGLIVGALSLVGFLAGAYLGSRIAPILLHGGSRSPYAPLRPDSRWPRAHPCQPCSAPALGTTADQRCAGLPWLGQ